VPTLPPRACGTCKKGFTGATCPNCTKSRQNDDATRKRVDASTFLRNKRVWRDRTSPSIISANPICQRIRMDYRNGTREQCRRPSTVVHHRIGPNGDATLFFSVYLDGVSQLIALCAACHAEERDPGGTPHWKENVDFVRTQYETPKVF